MLPVSMQSSSVHVAYRSEALAPSQLPVTPSQLPAEPTETPSARVDSVTLSNWATWQAAQSVTENPVAVSAVSQNEQVDEMAGAVYMNQMARQAIQTYTETYQMASEMWQTPETQAA